MYRTSRTNCGLERAEVGVICLFETRKGGCSMSDIEECDVCHGEGEIHDADFSDGDSDQQMFIKQDTLRPCPKCSRSEPTAESFADKPVCDVDVVTCEYQFPDEHPEPTYTMQQAVDKIVDGLVLEWGGRTERVAAKTVFGEYVVYLAGTESHGQWWSRHLEPVGGDYIANGEADASGEDGRLKALGDCLDDYKSRVRTEIEKAVES